MKWDDEKINMLKDGYPYMEDKELAEKIGCSTTALVKKASRIKLKKATNNQVVDGIKYCTFCKTHHKIENFYRDKNANGGFQYYCKLYYISHNPRETTTPPMDKSHNSREGITYTLDWKKNPPIMKDGILHLYCKSCQKLKPLYTEFYKNKNMINGVENVCKECRKNKSKSGK